ncbi:MAG: pyridoxamine 5'-phosphate oxidase [Loktanella sp.]|nr:pyridoxamine 5'-phosphate oxidase [Loktanella sp.]
MTDRTGIFAGDDPFVLARSWIEEARETEPNDPDAAALATVDADGLPNVRVVLMRKIEDDAFVFFSNFESAKGREIAATGKAAFVIHWKSLRRQIRVRGEITREDGAVADSYYESRPLQSRIGAWASAQSQVLSSRDELAARVAQAEAKHGQNPSRPPFWGGFRIRPVEIEFWADGPYRLHDRFRWTRPDCDTAWDVHRLSP